jgi:hypothetical protein
MNSATDFPPPRMRLAYHLAIVLAVKLVLLALLWHAFIGPNKVRVDVDAMGERIARAVSSVSSPASSGEHK